MKCQTARRVPPPDPSSRLKGHRKLGIWESVPQVQACVLSLCWSGSSLREERGSAWWPEVVPPNPCDLVKSAAS